MKEAVWLTYEVNWLIWLMKNDFIITRMKETQSQVEWAEFNVRTQQQQIGFLSIQKQLATCRIYRNCEMSITTNVTIWHFDYLSCWKVQFPILIVSVDQNNCYRNSLVFLREFGARTADRQRQNRKNEQSYLGNWHTYQYRPSVKW